MEALQRQINRTFEDFGSRSAPPFRTAFLPGRAARGYPLINLYEDGDALYIEALAPGVSTESLKVSVIGNTLTVSGEKPSMTGVRPEAFHRSERAAGAFTRNIDLPVEVDESKIKANYQDGVLMVTLPKAERAKPKQINVLVS